MERTHETNRFNIGKGLLLAAVGGCILGFGHGKIPESWKFLSMLFVGFGLWMTVCCVLKLNPDGFAYCISAAILLACMAVYLGWLAIFNVGLARDSIFHRIITGVGAIAAVMSVVSAVRRPFTKR